MAKSTPVFDLRKRLVGAFILIGFGVIVLPQLLGGPQPVVAKSPIQEAEKDNTKVFISKITPIGGATPKVTKLAQSNSKSAGPTAPAKGENTIILTSDSNKKKLITKLDIGAKTNKKAEKKSGKTKTKAKSAEKAETAKTEPRIKQESAVDEIPIEPGWVVRVGTFVKRDNAERVMKRLRKAGFEPSSGEVNTAKGVGLRVWVGPYSQRVQAARIRNEVLQATGEKGFIAAYP